MDRKTDRQIDLQTKNSASKTKKVISVNKIKRGTGRRSGREVGI